MTGKLLVLEGLDGAGTTTQARRLADALAARGRRAHVTREPSDGPIGRLLREMLTGAHAPVAQPTFSLLFAADRMDHVDREVEPQLRGGAIVISDRWYHSSLAYQGTGAERAWIWELNARARRPDLTIFLRVAPAIAAERRVAAGRAQELFEDLAMQEQVARGYEEVIAALAGDGERIEVIDGEQPLDAVTAAIVSSVVHLLEE